MLSRQRAAFDAWMERHRLAYATLIVVAACFVLVLFVDLPLAIWLNSGAWVALDPAFRLIGELGRPEGFVAAAILLALLAAWSAWRLDARDRGPEAAWWRWVLRHCYLLFATLLSSTALLHLLKQVVGRLRPRVWFSDGHYGLDWPFAGFPADSFPSGHTQVAFAVAVAIALAAPRWALVVYLLAALVGLSRIVNEMHYLSDVVAAAFMVIALALLWKRWFLDPAARWPGTTPLAWPALWRARRRRDPRGRQAAAKSSPASTRA